MKNKFFAKLTALVATAALLLTGCGDTSVDPDAALMTIDGEVVVTYAYGNFVARYTQSVYDSVYVYYLGEDVWQQEYSDDYTFEDSLKDGVLDTFIEIYLLCAHADDYGLSLTDEEEEAIAETAAAFIAANNADTLEIMTATEEIVIEYLQNQTLAYKVEKAILEETELTVTDEDAAQRGYTYVYFSTAGTEEDDDGNTIDLTDDEIAEIEAEATALAEAEDFDAYVEEMEYTSTSTTYGTDDEPFNECVMEVLNELTEGEIAVVYDEDALKYYVLRLDSEYDEEATAEVKAELEEEQQEEHYDEVITEWGDEIEWEVDEELWATVKFDTLFNEVSDDEDEDEE